MAASESHELNLSENLDLFEKFKELSSKATSEVQFLEKLLEHDEKRIAEKKAGPSSGKTSTWIPKIGLDTENMSVEIDVGSQVVVVNLSDFYKQKDGEVRIEEPVHSVELETAADDSDSTLKKVPKALESNLDLLASTANMMVQGSGSERGGKRNTKGDTNGTDKKYSCSLCNCVCNSQMMLKFHYGSVHGTVLHSCRNCSQSFLRKRDLEKHSCDPALGGIKLDRDMKVPANTTPAALKTKPATKGVTGKPSKVTSPEERQGNISSGDKSAGGGMARKEAYVCRVCQSKFREPTQVLKHLKKFHKEHARKAWVKFQENLKQRKQPEGSSPASVPSAGGGTANGPEDDSQFSVRALSETKLKLKMSKPKAEKAVRAPKTPKVKKPAGTPRVKKSPGTTSNSTNPGSVTCGVCSGTKYYTFTMQCRKFGSYTCESCKKFVTRFASNPTPGKCDRDTGNCHIPVLIPRHSAKRRCRACWLKRCLAAFNMPEALHNELRGCLPIDMQVDVPLGHMKEFVVTGKVVRDNERYAE